MTAVEPEARGRRPKDVRTIALGFVLATAVTGCGGSSAPAPVPPATALHGASVAGLDCTNPRPGGSLTSTGARLFLLCPSAYPQGQPEVTVHRGDPAFAPLLSALMQPDEAKSTGPCPEYADVTQVVLAETDQGPMLVHIPVDGCSHYQRDALAAIAQARSHDAAGAQP